MGHSLIRMRALVVCQLFSAHVRVTVVESTARITARDPLHGAEATERSQNSNFQRGSLAGDIEWTEDARSQGQKVQSGDLLARV